MHKLFYALLTWGILFSTHTQAQSKKIPVSIENIWEQYVFYPRQSVRGLKSLSNGEHFSTTNLSANTFIVLRNSYQTGEVVDTLFSSAWLSNPIEKAINDYEISPDERFILLFTEKESIYRYSSKSVVYVFDRELKKQYLISPDKVQLPRVSPDAKYVSFVKNNNLYLYNLSNNSVKAITNDGKKNHIINGATDWVYEEEFQFDSGYEWAPDGKHLAFYRFDESEVKEFSMDVFGEGLYPSQERFKYPKAGEDNAKVTIHVFSPEKGSKHDITIPGNPEYVGRIKWRNNRELVLFTLNRHQNNLKLFNHDVSNQKTELWYEEQDDAFVEMDDNQIFLEDGSLLRLSAKNGYYHIYHISGKKQRQLTSGKWDVTELYGYNPVSKQVFFQAAMDNPMNRGIHSITLTGKGKIQNLHEEEGWNNATFSDQCMFYILNHSRVEDANTYKLFKGDGTHIRDLAKNNQTKEALHSRFFLGEHRFMQIPAEDGTPLNAYMITPPAFDSSKTYPVLMYVYGGPGSQTVKNSYDGFNFFWYQHLAAKGYIVVSVDNRGTGARGRDFKKITYQQLGHYELLDQIAAAKWLGEQSYIDAKRIGIWGWSYGGYMSSLGITKGADVFKAAIAVAPVTTWRYYNTIYTERYMRTPQENPEGYDLNSPINFTEKIKGNYLLVHGTADDNVHVQNAMQMSLSLINNNIPFQQFMYPDRDHGIVGGKTRLHLYNMMTRFIEENL
jgi:dipeptidyl-peptidase 4